MKRIIGYLIILLSVILPAQRVHAQEEVGSRESKKVIEAISDSYKNWGRAAWSGRLSSDLLPVSATVKVYMEKGKLTLISVRAPFLGEVGRIEVDADSVLMVNKMKRRYYSRSIAEISQMAPDLTEDMQSLMLGRMFVIGEGQLGRRCQDSVEIFPTANEGCYMVVPKVPDYLPELVYGFATDAEMRMATFVAAYGRKAVDLDTEDATDPAFSYEPEMQLQAELRYRPTDGATVEMQFLKSGKSYTATLSVDAIEWGGKGFDRIDISGYTRTPLKQIFRF